MEGSMSGSQMSKLGNFKGTMKTANLDLRMEDSEMHFKCWVAVRQHLRQHRASAFATALMYTKVRCSAAEIACRE